MQVFSEAQSLLVSFILFSDFSKEPLNLSDGPALVADLSDGSHDCVSSFIALSGHDDQLLFDGQLSQVSISFGNRSECYELVILKIFCL